MKRTFLLKTVILLCALVAGSSSVWAEEEVYYTLDGTITTGGNSNYAQDGGGLTQNDMDWSVTGNTTINPWRIGGKNLDGVDREVYSKTAMGDAITKIELVLGDITITANSIKLIVASKSDFSTVLQTIEKTSISQNTTLTFNPSGDNWATGAYYKLVFNVTETNNSNKYIQVKSVKFYHTASASTVLTPTFDPASGTYTTAQNVTITCGTSGATIHYTTNGDDPTENDATYSSAVSITTSGTVLKAKAFKADMVASSVASATYTIKPNKPYVSATGATVTINGNSGLDFYYTTDNSAPTKSSTHYTAPFDLSADCTIKAIAYDAYDNASEVTSYTFKYFPLNPKNINSGYFEKVTDANTLENGDAILIVYETDNVAMSTDQKTNNRGEASVTISGNTISAPSADVQKLVLVKTTAQINSNNTDVFYFYTGTGYLYAASGSSNHLKTEDNPDDNNNARATITISEGNATILFTGTNGRNWLKYNPNGNNDGLFSCYTSTDNTMKIVQIYKEVTRNPSDPVVEGETVTLTTTENMDGWRTFYDADQGYTADENTTVYVASENTATKVTLEDIGSKNIPSGTPVILKTSAANRQITLTKGDIPAINITNELRASTANQNLGTVYRLGFGSNGISFYKYTTTSAPAGIVYVPNVGNTEAPSLTIEFGSGATSIEKIANSEESTANGQYYNLNGQRVAQPTKGLYIVNGKKVVIK